MRKHGRKLLPTLWGFVDGTIAYAIAAGLSDGASATWLGILWAAGIFAAMGLVVETGIGAAIGADSDRVMMRWMLAGLVWFVVGPPAAAVVAPGYELHGVGAVCLVIVVMHLVSWALGRLRRPFFERREGPA